MDSLQIIELLDSLGTSYVTFFKRNRFQNLNDEITLNWSKFW